MSTHTRTHVYVEFANPYLECDRCHHRAVAWHDPQRCDCGDTAWNQPCGHTVGVSSVCPSWSPVDGCRCLAHLGYVPHLSSAVADVP